MMLNISQLFLLLFTFILFFAAYCFGAAEQQDVLRVATINIWHGGSHSQQGLMKFAQHIGQINPDIVALQEVYGDGAEVLTELLNKRELPAAAHGHHQQNKWTAAARPCKHYTDTALLTRHKFVEFADDGCELWGNGAKIQLIGKGQQIVVNAFGMHLDYVNYGPDAFNDGINLQQILHNEQVRVKNIRQLFALPQFQRWNGTSTFEPLLVLGDMNSPSHEDWSEATSKLHAGQTVPWPTTKLIMEEGQFEDAFRTVYPQATEHPGVTWPFPHTSMPNGDRIDYVFFKGSKMMKPMNASLHLHPPPLKPFDLPAVEWPSDHFGLIVDFLLLKGN